MQTILAYSPGQVATISLIVQDGYGVLANSLTTPVISYILFPNTSLATGFPANMTQVSTGVYQYKFMLPLGAAAVGNYIVNQTYTDPVSLHIKNALTEIQVNVPFGNFSVSPG